MVMLRVGTRTFSISYSQTSTSTKSMIYGKLNWRRSTRKVKKPKTMNKVMDRWRDLVGIAME